MGVDFDKKIKSYFWSRVDSTPKKFYEIGFWTEPEFRPPNVEKLTWGQNLKTSAHLEQLLIGSVLRQKSRPESCGALEAVEAQLIEHQEEQRLLIVKRGSLKTSITTRVVKFSRDRPRLSSTRFPSRLKVTYLG